MSHGYARGCRCDQCREKHRLSQLKYRTGVRATRKTDTIANIRGRLVSYGVNDEIAAKIAADLYAEFM